MNEELPNSKMSGEALSNYGFNLASALQIRLDVQNVLREADMYLRGITHFVCEYDDNGRVINEKPVFSGCPLVNDLGHQAIMTRIRLTINQAAVQGNFLDYDMYTFYLCKYRQDFACDLMINRIKYGLDLDNYNAVINTVMNLIYPYYSRLLFDRERGSYANTIKYQESTVTQPRTGGFMSKIPLIGKAFGR